jgi:SNF2 family DNA or RNA helicase
MPKTPQSLLAVRNLLRPHQQQALDQVLISKPLDLIAPYVSNEVLGPVLVLCREVRYIFSMDILSLRGTYKSGDLMADKLLEFGFKFVIADEEHSFKNTDSNRTEALVKIKRIKRKK